MKLESEQEILMHIADMAMITFHAESALLRVMKLSSTKNENELHSNWIFYELFYMILPIKLINTVKMPSMLLQTGMNKECS